MKTPLKFTKREQQILRLVSNGKTSKEIGLILNISIHTVNTHRRKALKKAGVKNSIALLNKCEREAIQI